MWLPYTDTVVVVASNPVGKLADAQKLLEQPAKYTPQQRLQPLMGAWGGMVQGLGCGGSLAIQPLMGAWGGMVQGLGGGGSLAMRVWSP